jgi:23S rRNA pseudouridine1911/1915/1917 synthase
MNQLAIDQESAGMRLDLFLTRHPPEGASPAVWTRSVVQSMIAEGWVTLNGRRTKASVRLKNADSVEVKFPAVADAELAAEPIDISIIYEDDDMAAVNKAPGVIVHPAAGVRSGTLVNAILYRWPALRDLSGDGRPGIVHRLDKDTSGVIVIAKNASALRDLAAQFKERRVRKEYLAIVWGGVRGAEGVIDRPIGRHRVDRKRMSSVASLATRRGAVTGWKVEERFVQPGDPHSRPAATLLRLFPYTGRTHQIRVHLADQGTPVVGDRLYGRRPAWTQKSALGLELARFPRQALHAERLELTHPRTGVKIEMAAALHNDMVELLAVLRRSPLRREVRQ